MRYETGFFPWLKHKETCIMKLKMQYESVGWVCAVALLFNPFPFSPS